ncbi:MAG: phytanoyl-CoA dioxygenase family protein [Gammaproteobacteria bacterium]|nr:phytanoyl-CoA dioxygenase family protein [Gammaproteobacteria bacterium]
MADNRPADVGFETDGFSITGSGVIEAQRLDAARRAVTDVLAGQFDTGEPPSAFPPRQPGVLTKIDNAHFASNALYELLMSPGLAALIRAVTGSKFVQVFNTQLLVKPSTDGSTANVGWHQDKQYWPFWDRPEGLFTAWVALTEVDAAAGPMRFVAGSHHWGLLNQGNFFGQDTDALRASIKTPPGSEWREVPAVMSAGGASLHHALAYHGSGANVSGRDRISVAIHMRNELPGLLRVEENPLYFRSIWLEDQRRCPVLYDRR